MSRLTRADPPVPLIVEEGCSVQNNSITVTWRPGVPLPPPGQSPSASRSAMNDLYCLEFGEPTEAEPDKFTFRVRILYYSTHTVRNVQKSVMSDA